MKTTYFCRKWITSAAIIYSLLELAGTASTYYWVDYFRLHSNTRDYGSIYPNISALAADSSGSVYAAINSYISRSTFDGVEYWEHGLGGINCFAFDNSGDLYSLSGSGQVSRLTFGVAVTPYASIPGTVSMAFDGNNNLFVGGGSTITRITPTGETSLFATTSGSLFGQGLAFDSNGRLFAETSVGVEVISSGGTVNTYFSWSQVSAMTPDPFRGASGGITIDAADNLVYYITQDHVSHDGVYQCVSSLALDEGVGSIERWAGSYYVVTQATSPLGELPEIGLVPEPSAFALAGLGLATLLACRKTSARVQAGQQAL